MILGQFAGGPAVRTDYNQTDPGKADYLVGRENIAPKTHVEDKNNPHGVTAAQAGAAPSGYGLGMYSNELPTATNANNCVKNGWYYVSSSTPNAPGGGGGVVRVDAHNENSIRQVYFSDSATSAGTIVCERTCKNGVWGEWCYENPPMSVGEEYRTTERWNGQIVYTILIDCGLTATLASVQAPTGAIRILRWEARSDKHALPIYDYIGKASYYAYTYLNPTNHLAIMYEADKKSDGFGNGGYHWYCQMWYTKQ